MRRKCACMECRWGSVCVRVCVCVCVWRGGACVQEPTQLEQWRGGQRPVRHGWKGTEIAPCTETELCGACLWLRGVQYTPRFDNEEKTRCWSDVRQHPHFWWTAVTMCRVYYTVLVQEEMVIFNPLTFIFFFRLVVSETRVYICMYTRCQRLHGLLHPLYDRCLCSDCCCCAVSMSWKASVPGRCTWPGGGDVILCESPRRVHQACVRPVHQTYDW